jgi:hypothetical protein
VADAQINCYLFRGGLKFDPAGAAENRAGRRPRATRADEALSLYAKQQNLVLDNAKIKDIPLDRKIKEAQSVLTEIKAQEEQEIRADLESLREQYPSINLQAISQALIDGKPVPQDALRLAENDPKLKASFERLYKIGKDKLDFGQSMAISKSNNAQSNAITLSSLLGSLTSQLGRAQADVDDAMKQYQNVLNVGGKQIIQLPALSGDETIDKMALMSFFKSPAGKLLQPEQKSAVANAIENIFQPRFNRARMLEAQLQNLTPKVPGR